ncbi:hypothetical protein [Luteibacter yeojuensis]|uniref:Uncharacterized protein n=1 Tax=Luteibacter yeojuensis TaxID=345309 RepID=A0A7X5QS40_9GAMM|nr:hypothetical protein [Luteibacter yeojuensis]NID14381.1 hypothetical protein [Luteibacter yeojuensis]
MTAATPTTEAKTMNGEVDVVTVMETCEAYVDDAAQFPEQFKPGVVARHQRQYKQARDAVSEAVVNLKGAKDALSQNATFPSDIALARKCIDRALSRLTGAA